MRAASIVRAPATVRAPADTSARKALLQRKCACGGVAGLDAECVECRQKKLQRATSAGVARRAAESPVPSLVPGILGSPGQPLETNTRAFMESRFGHRFDGVRVHTDTQAAESARQVGALAYTVGNDTVFARGQYAPMTGAGLQLIAHELTHTIQQAAGVGSAAGLRVAGAGDATEREADTAAQAIMHGQTFSPVVGAQPHVARQSPPPAPQASPQASPAPASSAPQFPAHGVKVIGAGAADLATILSFCVGAVIEVDSSGMLVEQPLPIPSSEISTTATGELSRILRDRTVGIIIDTNPRAEQVTVGAFSHANPGYQRVDIANIKTLAAASGARGGGTACDLLVHEISEAYEARRLVLARRATGRALFTAAHAHGTQIETRVRAELGLPAREQAAGNLVVMGNVNADALALLESTIYGTGADRTTQLYVTRCDLGPLHTPPGGQPTRTCVDNTVVASHVIRGEVTFSTQMEALRVFNRYASDFGLAPIPLPANP